MRKRLFIALSAVVLLIAAAVGGIYWSKKDTFAVPDGWKEYRNEEWNFKVVYPEIWFVKESKTENNLFVFFDKRSIPERLPPEAVFAITISVSHSSVNEIMKSYENSEKLTDLYVGNTKWLRRQYFSNPLNRNDLVHIRNAGNYRIVVIADETVVRWPEFNELLRGMEVIN